MMKMMMLMTMMAAMMMFTSSHVLSCPVMTKHDAEKMNIDSAGLNSCSNYVLQKHAYQLTFAKLEKREGGEREKRPPFWQGGGPLYISFWQGVGPLFFDLC